VIGGGAYARSGAAAVELALLLPFLALAFSATTDFARVFHATQVLDSAAYAGALTASGVTWTPKDPNENSQDNLIENAKRAACAEASGSFTPKLQESDVGVTITGGMATVTVSCDYPLMSAVLNPSASVRLSRTVTMAVIPRPGE
jgi:Flp pilus assembly protein TadG